MYTDEAKHTGGSCRNKETLSSKVFQVLASSTSSLGIKHNENTEEKRRKRKLVSISGLNIEVVIALVCGRKHLRMKHLIPTVTERNKNKIPKIDHEVRGKEPEDWTGEIN